MQVSPMHLHSLGMVKYGLGTFILNRLNMVPFIIMILEGIGKLLLSKKEIRELIVLFYKKGYDYSFKNFFKNGFAKVQIGLAKGKKEIR